MDEDEDGLIVTPLARAQRRATEYRTDRQLYGEPCSGRPGLSRRELQKLRIEVRDTKIAIYIKALLEFGKTEPTAAGDPQWPITSCEEAIAAAAARFGVSDATAWRAWRTYLNGPPCPCDKCRRARLLAKCGKIKNS